MKITFTHNDNSTYLELIPETVNEANQLMDFAANSTIESTQIAYVFNTSMPRGEIFIRSVKSRAKKYRVQNRNLKQY